MEKNLAQQEVFKCHFNLLNCQKTDHAYTEFVINKVIPLFVKIYPEHVKKLESAIKLYGEHRKNLIDNVLTEVRNIYQSLKYRLEEEGLWDSAEIKKVGSLIEDILSGKKACVMPAQYEEAVEHLKQFLYEIVALNREDLVNEYISSYSYPVEQINLDSFSFQCDDCFKLSKGLVCSVCGNETEVRQNAIYRRTKTIALFNMNTFVPSFFSLSELEINFCKSAAGAWYTLDAVKRFWNIASRDFFRKELYYRDSSDCQRAAQLLNLNLARKEIQDIKKETGNNDLFKRSQLEYALEIIINELKEKTNYERIPAAFGPESIEIVYVVDDLFFKITWTSGIIEKCHIRHFHEADNIRSIFFKDLVNSPRTVVELPLKEIKGAYAKKYLIEAGLQGVLYKIFFDRVSKRKAVLKSTNIDLTTTSESFRKKLSKQLQTFKHVDWL